MISEYKYFAAAKCHLNLSKTLKFSFSSKVTSDFTESRKKYKNEVLAFSNNYSTY